MNTYSLRIVTPDGVRFDGEASSLLVRTVNGDVQILAHHSDLLAAVGTGRAVLTVDGTEKSASCSGGFLSVTGGDATLAVTTWEFADEIDLERAKAAKERAETAVNAKSSVDLEIAKAKLARALCRISVAENK